MAVSSWFLQNRVLPALKAHPPNETIKMTTSFPFLKIARERNIPYGVVIRLVQALERIPGTPIQRAEMNWSIIYEDVREAMDEEKRRRFIVEQCK